MATNGLGIGEKLALLQLGNLEIGEYKKVVQTFRKALHVKCLIDNENVEASVDWVLKAEMINAIRELTKAIKDATKQTKPKPKVKVRVKHETLGT